MSILAAVWKLSIGESRLAVDKGFYSAIQDILKVEDVVFTLRWRGVLNDTMRRNLVSFSRNFLFRLAKIS